MALSEDEKLLVEAFRGALRDQIGLKGHQPQIEELDERERGSEYLHQQIDELFHHKTADLDHHTGVCAAFARVHSYKYVDDPRFKTVMDREMKAQAIPTEDRQRACDTIDAIIAELKRENRSWSEQDAGWVDMEEIEEACFPEPNNGLDDGR